MAMTTPRIVKILRMKNPHLFSAPTPYNRDVNIVQAKNSFKQLYVYKIMFTKTHPQSQPDLNIPFHKWNQLHSITDNPVDIKTNQVFQKKKETHCPLIPVNIEITTDWMNLYLPFDGRK